MCPYKGKPDCFNCPLDDCEASGKEISHQEGIISQEIDKARNNTIVKAFMDGADIDGLAERFNVTSSAIRYVLSQAGVNYKELRKEHRRCWR